MPAALLRQGDGPGMSKPILGREQPSLSSWPRLMAVKELPEAEIKHQILFSKEARVEARVVAICIPATRVRTIKPFPLQSISCQQAIQASQNINGKPSCTVHVYQAVGRERRRLGLKPPLALDWLHSQSSAEPAAVARQKFSPNL
ncbi:hypothetical protein CRENBAI_009113 [Crenichthys baileyi]|uniref:Uncharacterized protein n=1 Tax=Crenichthys baileyi TaxID=28760 RepID=A0AAV9SQ93_9TELE